MNYENTKMEYAVNIHDVLIKIRAGSKEIYDYTLRELDHFVIQKCEKADLFIYFQNEKYQMPETCQKVNKNVIMYQNIIAICIKAHFRKTWITIQNLKNGRYAVRVFLHVKKGLSSEIKRILTLNYLYPWQNSMIDFFHGIFLGLLQYKLFKKKTLIVHSAALVYRNKCFVILADAAAGKSTITDYLVNMGVGKFISEDYCMIDHNQQVQGLFNQRRVALSSAYRMDSVCVGERINDLFCKIMGICGHQGIRIRSVGELFSPENVNDCSSTDYIFYLKRKKEERTCSDLCTTIRKIMRKEIRNWDGVNDWLRAENSYCKFWRQYNEILKALAEVYQFRVWDIPFQESIDSLVLKVTDCMDKEVNQHGCTGRNH